MSHPPFRNRSMKNDFVKVVVSPIIILTLSLFFSHFNNTMYLASSNNPRVWYVSLPFLYLPILEGSLK